MQALKKNTKLLIATSLCYAASWIALGLGAIWIWLGILSLQPGVEKNPIFNPVLILDGVIVLISAYFIYQKSTTTVKLLTLYALLMEIYLQVYTLAYYGRVKLKPYFVIELLGLVFANVGVFWYHKLNNNS